MSADGFSRRELFRQGGLLGGALALPGLLPAAAAAAAAAKPPVPAKVATPAGVGLRIGPDIYQSIGVRPIVNARGTFTILSGSTMLPEVREAMAAASQHYVHLDELAEAIGGRLATLTGAEWGLVTNGCSAALTHARSRHVAASANGTMPNSAWASVARSSTASQRATFASSVQRAAMSGSE